jgi:glycosyltransferase involved in cell wall biosynthesis
MDNGQLCYDRVGLALISGHRRGTEATMVTEVRGTTDAELAERPNPLDQISDQTADVHDADRHPLHAARVVAIIPAHNEARSIGSVVVKTLRYADLTADVASDAGAIVLRHSVNQGKGAALNTGFKKAFELGAEVVVTLDGDGQHLPEEMPRLVTSILKHGADIVVGSRYLDSNSDVPRVRVLGHQVFNAITSLSSGVAVSDSQSGYRAFSKAALGAIRFNSKGFSVESEMQFLARDYHLKVTEVPIVIRYDDKPKRNVFMQGLGVLNGILRLIGQHRPLLFMCVPGLLALVASVTLGILVVNIYAEHQILATGYALLTVLLAIAGLVLVNTGVMLHSVRGLLLDLVRPR